MQEMTQETDLAQSRIHFPSADDHVGATVASVERIQGITMLVAMGLLALLVVVNWISSGFFNALIVAIVAVFVFMGFAFAANLLVLGPMQTVRYKACVKFLVDMVHRGGMQPTSTWTWHAPAPGICAVDARRKLVFIESRGTGFQPLLLRPEQILGAKVERESEVYTTTTHSGRTSVFGSNLGHTFGGKSHSTSTVVERAFLEIHYQLEPQGSPGWVAIPFGANRRDADSMAAAITTLSGR